MNDQESQLRCENANLTRSLNMYLDENKTLREKVARLTKALHGMEAHPDFEYYVQYLRGNQMLRTDQEPGAGWDKNPESPLSQTTAYARLVWRKRRPSEHEADALKKGSGT